MPATYIPIQSTTLSSSAATVTFSNIPQTYTDLVIRASVRSDRSGSGTFDYLIIRLNGLTTSVYSETTMYGDGASVASARQSSATSMYYTPIDRSTSTSNTFSSTEYYIPNYTAATNKPISSISTEEENVSSPSYLFSTAQLFSSTAAITQITFLSVAAGVNLVAGSSFHLYGIKKD